MKKWFISSGESDKEIAALSDVISEIQDAQSLKSGTLSVCADDGPRLWLHRILGAKRYIRSYFSLEWDCGFAGLIFHDDNGSEYRAIDTSKPTNAGEDIRKKISFGEYQPLPNEFCIEKDRAFSAVIEFINDGLRRPNWLDYKFIK